MEINEQQKLFSRLDDLENLIKKIITPMSHKQSRDKLYEALAKAKLEYQPIFFNRQNSFNKQVYADLEALENATRKPLGNHGLSFIQEPRDIDGTTFLFSTLGHASGQDIEIKNRLIAVPSKGIASDHQRFGESLAFMKRQVMQSVLGIVANNDKEDNDDAGESAATYTNTEFKPVRVDQGIFSEKITHEQLETLYYELQDYPIMTQSLIKLLKIRDLADMPKAEFLTQMQNIRKQKIALTNSPMKEW